MTQNVGTPEDIFAEFAKMQREIKELQNALRKDSRPACYLYKATGQSIPSGSMTPLLFDGEVYDTDEMHSTTSNTSRVTIRTPGIYLLTGHLSWVASSTVARFTDFLANGITQIASQRGVSDGGFAETTLAVTRKFKAGEYVEFRTYQASGSAIATQATNLSNPQILAATWLGNGE